MQQAARAVVMGANWETTESSNISIDNDQLARFDKSLDDQTA
jgi:hypothetical protein